MKKDKLYMYILESKNIENEVTFILYESLDNTKFDIYKISINCDITGSKLNKEKINVKRKRMYIRAICLGNSKVSKLRLSRYIFTKVKPIMDNNELKYNCTIKANMRCV